MDDKEANIDLVFRNGLKNYEVLPPPEIWDKITPAIQAQQRPYIFLRVAAMVAVLATLSILTYTWNDQAAGNLSNSSEIQEIVTGTPETEVNEAPLIADAGSVKRIEKSKPVFTPVIEEVISQPVADDTETSLDNPARIMAMSDIEKPAENSQLLVRENFSSRSLTPEEYADLRKSVISSPGSKNKWTIAALVSPTYISSFNSPADESASQLGSYEQSVVSYAGGIALSYKVNKRFSVQSGLYYTSYGTELSGITSFGGFKNYDQFKGNSNFEIHTTNGTVSTNNSDVYLIDNLSDSRMASYFDKTSFDPAKASLNYLNSSLRQDFGYLELPVIIRYKIVDRAFDFNVIGGVSSNVLVNNSVYTSVNGGKYEVGKTEGLNSVIFSSSLGMGMEYNLTGNLSINLEPTFRYYLNPFTNVSGINNVHPYSFGIYSGLSFKF
jgi:hypothetical protein